MRDSKNQYHPLERHFGTLSTGMAFGESMLLGSQEPQRFFNAIAMSECIVLTLQRVDFEYMMHS
jgi:CRP-like cAMP-binding protein